MENESNSSNQLTENIEKEEDIKKSTINSEQEQEPKGKGPEQEEPFNRNIKVYNPPSQDASFSNKINLPDSFYELSPSELKNLLSMQNSKRLASDNSGFKTRAMRQKEDEEKERKYPKTLIRVKFPDSYQMQVAFLSKEPVGTLYEFIKSSLKSPERLFYLYTSPPKLELSDKKISFYRANLAPASVVYFNWKDKATEYNGPYLSEEYLIISEDLPKPTNIESDTSSSKTKKNSSHESKKSNSAFKWLKLGKK